MNLLRNAWDWSLTALGHIWDGVMDIGWSLWTEIQDGSSRLSWWLLMILVWLDGVLMAKWFL